MTETGNPNFQAAQYRLIYTRIDGDGGLRARSADIDPLIDLTENEQHLYDSACVVDMRGHLIYEPSLGREIVQLEAPPDDEPGWWRDNDGYWHQEPC